MYLHIRYTSKKNFNNVSLSIANKHRLYLWARDVSNPSNNDQYFPVARHKDIYTGFSWASGLVPGTRQEESASEVSIISKNIQNIFCSNIHVVTPDLNIFWVFPANPLWGTNKLLQLILRCVALINGKYIKHVCYSILNVSAQ